MPSKRLPTSETQEALTAAELEPMTPTEEKKDDNNGKTELKKELGLLEGIAIILGIIIGSGKSESGLLVRQQRVTLSVMLL